MSIEELKELKK
jgi:hypothetical protein